MSEEVESQGVKSFPSFKLKMWLAAALLGLLLLFYIISKGVPVLIGACIGAGITFVYTRKEKNEKLID